MKLKMKENIAVSDAAVLLNTFSRESFHANEPGMMITEKVRKNHSNAHIEEFILSEFEIDSETMEEHMQELLVYMMHNQLIDKIPQD
jgi:hypothetical protein